jgi:preprotein translocase subunit SecE
VERINLATTNPAQFIQEVRQEASKVTWPSRKESGISTVMVFVMVIVSAIFFMVVDWALQHGVRIVLGIGG